MYILYIFSFHARSVFFCTFTFPTNVQISSLFTCMFFPYIYLISIIDFDHVPTIPKQLSSKQCLMADRSVHYDDFSPCGC